MATVERAGGRFLRSAPRPSHAARRHPAWLAPLCVALALAGCATRSGYHGRDGAEANPPADLDRVPDAVPRIEAIRPGGPNKPYAIAGHTYVPITDDRPVVERGLASWYGKRFQGHPTASGEAYNMYAMTAAHRTLPIPSYARVRNPANGREVIVRINDRGPFVRDRVIDLSYTAALKLGVLGGVAPVEVERITAEDIRSGEAFRHGGSGTAVAAAPPPAAAPAAGRPPTAVPVATSVAPSAGVARPSPLPPAATAVVANALPAATTPAAPVTLAAADPPPNPYDTTPPAPPAAVSLATPAPPPLAEETGKALTPAAAGFWVQLGAYRQRNGALTFQREVSDEQPWLAPLLAVYTDHGLNKLQAGPYPTREEATQAAERIRTALALVPTIVEKR